MKKKIFVKNQNMIEDIEINIDEERIRDIFSSLNTFSTSFTTFKRYCDFLVNNNDDVFMISKAITSLCEYYSNVPFEMTMKYRILDCITFNGISIRELVSSYNPEEEESLMKKIKSLITFKRNNGDNYKYSESYNQAINKKIQEIEDLNKKMYGYQSSLTGQLDFTLEESMQYKKRMTDSLPVIKKQK